jgi:AcrR family transcriptional regulator
MPVPHSARPGQETGIPVKAGSGRAAILSAAADCFMISGYEGTSIDDVAKNLNATKGMIYHYYRSKADLFFDVFRRGMAINLDTIRPIAELPDKPADKFRAMCHAHLRNMLRFISFQRVVMQGVEMHLAGPTTPAQREALRALMKDRECYELLFRATLLEGRESGDFQFENPSFASKAVLAVLNNPVLWYRPRSNENVNLHNEIVGEFTRFAMKIVCRERACHEERCYD